MTVKVRTEVEIDLDVLKDRLSPLELLDLFSAAANKMADGNVSFEQRRACADAFRRAMSENAKKLLAEAFSAEYIQQTLAVPEFP